jgi:nitroreductase
MLEKKAPTDIPIHELLARRWSPRAFDPGKPITRARLAILLEAARWAPSCNGDEPWRYLIWDKNRDAEGYRNAFECISDNNKRWVKNVPLLMLSCAGSSFQVKAEPNRWSQHDTGAASVCMALQAAALGLIVHQMGGFDADKARIAFGIPAEYTPMAMIAVGYQAEPDTIEFADIKDKELAPRTRKPLPQRFFEGGWGKGIQFG